MAEYIDREVLLAEIKTIRNQHLLSKCDGAKIEKLVLKIPTADVVPVRRGRWLLVRPGEWTATVKCSECGRRICIDPKADEPEKDYPYCHCGAKMDEGGGTTE